MDPFLRHPRESSPRCALVRDGIIQAWGDNANGQLDDGTTTHQVNPIPVSGITEAMAIATGDNHSLARLNDGRVMGWGKTAREASGMEPSITIAPSPFQRSYMPVMSLRC